MLTIKDRAKQRSTSTGTGPFVLGTPLSGYTTLPSGETYYTITHGEHWEVGKGTVSSGTLIRSEVSASSNGNGLVDFQPGIKEVFCVVPAELMSLLVQATRDSTADTLALRDASGRIRVSSPDSSLDAANKDYVDSGLASLNSAISGKASLSHTHTVSDITDSGDAISYNVGDEEGNLAILEAGGVFHDSRISLSSVQQHMGSISIQELSNVGSLESNAILVCDSDGTGVVAEESLTWDGSNLHVDGKVSCSASTYEVASRNSGSTTIVNWANNSRHSVTLIGDTVFSFIAPSDPSNLLMSLKQDSTGNRKVTWPNNVKWEDGITPVLSVEPEQVDLVTFWFDGEYYYGAVGLNFKVPD